MFINSLHRKSQIVIFRAAYNHVLSQAGGRAGPVEIYLIKGEFLQKCSNQK
jgi:hypothetical protein